MTRTQIIVYSETHKSISSLYVPYTQPKLCTNRHAKSRDHAAIGQNKNRITEGYTLDKTTLNRRKYCLHGGFLKGLSVMVVTRAQC